ncbi:MAG TPA: malectin [Lacunisphaera sp.]|nr:malectin [Lacunisphaera sp.]
MNRSVPRPFLPLIAALLFATAASLAPADEAKPAAAKSTIRINAGASADLKDAEGNLWLADQGFVGGDVIERDSDMKIANTTIPSIYHTEHYGMDSFSHKVANGKYTVKLHFAETYEGVDGPGQRVFSFDVEGHEYKDFDVFVKAGGVQRAYVVTVEVEVTDGKLDITFKSNVENPEINGIEIIPAA